MADKKAVDPYIVLTDDEVVGLEKDVEEHWNLGYRPHGSLVIDSEGVLHQPMVKMFPRTDG